MITTIAANKQTNRDKMIDVVCGDNNTKIVRLVVPIAVDGVDLSGLMWHIKFINSLGERDFHKANNVEITNDVIHIDWIIRGKATSKPGITQFQFEGLSDGDLVWQTSKMYLRVKDRIEVPEENTDEEESLTELQQLIIYVSSELSNVIAAGDNARDAASHPPIIGGNNNWFVYDWQTKQYIDTGKPSRGSGGNGSGEDGGYYTPTVSDDGELTWKASKSDMPEVPSVNIRGQDGEDGEDGITPHIGDNGNWFIGDIDTGMPSCGENGKDAPSDVVRYNSQGLSEDQQNQARENIGAVSEEDVSSAIEEVVSDFGGTVEITSGLPQKAQTVLTIDPDSEEINLYTAEETDRLMEELSEEIIENDLPTVYYGSKLPQIKTEQIMPLRIVSKTMDVKGYCETKAQGNSSMNFPKKNQTTKLFADVACEEKLKLAFRNWGKQNKFCLKANWNDLSHARNVVSARIWGDMVRTRPDFDSMPELMRTSPNFGAIDGFPVRVFADGVYQGRYAFNIPKDKWMSNMDDENPNHCILCAEDFGSGCFRSPALIDGNDWTDEIHDEVPQNILTRWNECITFVQTSTDEEFKANLHQYFNVTSLIDYHIFGLVSCNMDGFGKNQLFLTYDGQVWYASVYDMDATWGNHYMGKKLVEADYPRTSYEDYISSGSSGNGNLLYVRLESLFAEEIKARWNDVKTNALSMDNILHRFEQWASICPPWMIAEDYAETTAEGAFVDMPGQDYNNIQQIRAFAKARHAWTETYINGEPTVNLWNIGERTCILHPFSSTKDKVPNYEIGSNEFILSGARTGYISGNRNVEHTVTNNDLTFKVSESGVGLFMPVNITPGKTYRLRFTASDATGTMAVTWYDDTLKYIANTGALTPNNGLSYEGTFVAANYPNFVITAVAAGTTLPETITFSDVSLVELL